MSKTRPVAIGTTAWILFAAMRASALVLTVPPASAPPAAPVSVVVVLGDGGSRAVGLQVDLSISHDVLALDGCSIDPTLAALGFMLSARQSPWNPGRMRLVLLPTPDGFAAGARLPDGPLATCSGSIDSTAAPGRAVALTLSNAMAVDATPNALPVAVEAGVLTVGRPSAPLALRFVPCCRQGKRVAALQRRCGSGPELL
ncbi:MAG: hypothetical protein KatS3mg077_1548 [Candidatus Binatia bacterium]|nr:MAG: hypothetical protein KatS3mg077_1538 [Candidatus Binatia bacterium]GIW44266.1 MAG: hypothetical protein KatS3mg077_1548 [Candidatus Binatia bacterium]